ncbi:MAG: hypothetical protein ACI9K2_007123, partial [Myxococcota bacterium]
MFQAGGDLRVGSFYAERAADDALWRVLSSGGLAFVLAPRQIGKSSLGRRVARRLKADGWTIAHIDMNLVGAQSTDQDRWAFGLAAEVAGQVGWTLDQTEAWWDQQGRLGSIHRVSRLLRSLSADGRRLALFLDEIDGVMSLPFDPDDFFTALRALHNNDDEKALAMCLLGVATPGELVRDESRTPFNVGTAIRLEDLTREELEPLEEGTEDWNGDSTEWVDAVYGWTNGHPYMSQRVLGLLEESYEDALDDDEEDDWPPVPPAEMVDRMVDEAFLQDGRTAEANLIYAETRLDSMVASRRIKMVRLYRLLLRGERVPADVSDPDQQELLLSGMVARARDDAGEVLRVRNRVFATVFDEEWVSGKEALGEIFGAMRRWADGGRLPGDLLAGTALAEATAWFQDNTGVLDAEAYAYLEASQKQARAIVDQRAHVAELESARSREEVERQQLEREAAETRALLAQKLQETAEQRERDQRRARRLQFLVILILIGLVGITAMSTARAWRANGDLATQTAKLEAKTGELEVQAKELEEAKRVAQDQATSATAAEARALHAGVLERQAAIEAREAEVHAEQNAADEAEQRRRAEAAQRALDAKVVELDRVNSELVDERAESDRATAAKFGAIAIEAAGDRRAADALVAVTSALGALGEQAEQGGLELPEVYAGLVSALDVAGRTCGGVGPLHQSGLVVAWPSALPTGTPLSAWPPADLPSVEGVGGGLGYVEHDGRRVLVWFSGHLSIVDERDDSPDRVTTVEVCQRPVVAATWDPAGQHLYIKSEAGKVGRIDLSPEVLRDRVVASQG